MQLIKGDKKVAICTDCHGVHAIQAANVSTSKVYPNNIPKTCAHCHSNAEYMQEYNLPVDQYDLYVKSVHGINLFEKGDRTSPTCNDCHGNHGAFPPGISSISHVCGICHVSQVEMFLQSPHKKAFEEMDLPQCESCHGNHNVILTNVNMLGTGSESFCTTCHEAQSPGFLTAQKMKQTEDSLITKMNLAATLLEKAEKAGVEAGEGKFIFKETHNNFIKVRNAVHFFSLDKFQSIATTGIENANRAIAEGNLALEEVQKRRIWLAIISILIFLAAVSLYFKIKTLHTGKVD
jgi:predicted CXXCH cytochrome family protein